MITMTRSHEHTAATSTDSNALLMAFELGDRTWKLGFTTGRAQAPRIRQIPAGAIDRVLEEIARAKQRLHLSSEAPVMSCYEAGRDGFWLHRFLVTRGVTNYVVDSSSIEVPRRSRRAKTDRLDLLGLLRLLARYRGGEWRAWRVVRVPTVAEEDARHLHRAYESLQQDRTRLINRLKGLLITQGVRVPITEAFTQRLETLRLWDGAPVPPGLKQRLTRVADQLVVLNQQLAELTRARAALPIDAETAAGRCVARLPRLCGVGPISAWVFATEIFGWRQIANGRQLGSLVGLVPAPFQSGERTTDRGITRAGNKHVRRLIVQLAWGWIRYQPKSPLTLWFQRRFAKGSSRLRRIGIVAVARKLLIALWRYVDRNERPEGAIVKMAPA